MWNRIRPGRNMGVSCPVSMVLLTTCMGIGVGIHRGNLIHKSLFPPSETIGTKSALLSMLNLPEPLCVKPGIRANFFSSRLN